MALAIDISDGCGLVSVSLVTVEKELGNAVFAVHFIVKSFNQLY